MHATLHLALSLGRSVGHIFNFLTSLRILRTNKLYYIYRSIYYRYYIDIVSILYTIQHSIHIARSWSGGRIKGRKGEREGRRKERKNERKEGR